MLCIQPFVKGPMRTDPDGRKISFGRLLRPHAGILTIAIVAVMVEGGASLAEPWPLKLVLDTVLKTKPGSRWLRQVAAAAGGTDKLAMLKFAAIAVLVIAAVGAVSSYTERYLTTTIGYDLMHDLRQLLYSHIQRLSLAYHDRKYTGDLIGRLTSDIDSIQSFVASGLLGALVSSLTLAGMIALMFYLNWRFTLIAVSVAPLLFVVIFHYTRRIKRGSREVRKKEGEIVSEIQEVLSAIHVVKAFASEEYEQLRLAKESRESIRIALRVRGLKAKLGPTVDMIVAGGTCMVLWLGGRMVLRDALSAGSLVLFIWYLGKMYKPMRDLSKILDAYAKASVGFERIREVLETDGQVKDLPGARRAPQPPRPDRAGKRQFQLWAGSPDPKADQPGHRTGTGGRAGRADRGGKDHHHQPDSPFLRPRHWSRKDRRHRCEGLPARIVAAADQFRPAGNTAIPRTSVLQHRLREAECQSRGNRARGTYSLTPTNLSNAFRKAMTQ